MAKLRPSPAAPRPGARPLPYDHSPVAQQPQIYKIERHDRLGGLLHEHQQVASDVRRLSGTHRLGVDSAEEFDPAAIDMAEINRHLSALTRPLDDQFQGVPVRRGAR